MDAIRVMLGWYRVRVLAAVWLGCCGDIGVYAATIHIPADYATFGGAINAAQPGDEIVISPGTYELSTLLIPKRLTIRSTFDGTDWGIVENTIIKDSDRVGSLVQISLSASGSVVRGLTLSRDPLIIPPNGNVTARGIESSASHATIEYCIIENHVAVSNAGSANGAAIRDVHGAIQNNIIRNCRTDIGVVSGVSGVIRNNLLYDNDGGLGTGSGMSVIANNTLFNSGSFGHGGVGLTVNNIAWKTVGVVEYGGPTPQNCIIKGYTGTGENIITADPLFVDPANGDFRLRFDSPAIDAGIWVEGVPGVDLLRVERGIKGVDEERGDGSMVDIGAYEFVPVKNAAAPNAWDRYQ